MYASAIPDALPWNGRRIATRARRARTNYTHVLSNLLAAFEAKQAIVAAVGEQIEQAVGALPHVADALQQRMQHPLDVRRLRRKIHAVQLHPDRALRHRAKEEVALPLRKSIAGI